MRALMPTGPPAGNGTTMRSGRDGKSRAAAMRLVASVAAPAGRTRRRMDVVGRSVMSGSVSLATPTLLSFHQK